MEDKETLISLTSDIVSSFVANNHVATAEIAELIKSTHDALAGLSGPAAEPEAPRQEPAVSIRSSIKPDYLISLESGRRVKMLKRYLMTTYGMTPDDYRKKWGLPKDYPMVAPNYSEARKTLAKSIGLGRKKGAPSASAAEPAGEDQASAADDAPAAARKARKPAAPRKKPVPADAEND